MGLAWLQRWTGLGWHSLLDAVFPPRCLVCESSLPAGLTTVALCSDCRDEVQAERQRPYCPTCANSVAPYELSGGRCRECREVSLRVGGIVRVAGYRGPLGELMRAYKYHGQEAPGLLLAQWLAAAVQAAPWSGWVEAVVPVPTHWRHRLRRPLHAAEELARHVARSAGLPLVPLLRRRRGGPHQVGLPSAQRQPNVRGAFALEPGVQLETARLLLIDDVRTTGSTLEECAKVLLRAGAAEVYAGVVLRAGSAEAGA
ncbi:MAG TPA: ComF family protein [Phycisphaerae bacterium]|nr:ComF family protein [Phycisphaerae bacterium]HNU46450.1 ComF family protein [Phycisphaerae bacterium]